MMEDNDEGENDENYPVNPEYGDTAMEDVPANDLGDHNAIVIRCAC
jgi:hypothetical protein